MNAGAVRHLRILLLGLLFITRVAGAAPTTLSVDAITGRGWSAGALAATLDLEAPDGPTLVVEVQRLSLPAPLGELRNLRLRCASVRISAQAVVCPQVELRFAAHDGPPQSVMGTLRYSARDRRLQVAMPSIAVGGGTVTVALQVGAGGFTLALKGENLTVSMLAALLAPAPTLAGVKVTRGLANCELEWGMAADGKTHISGHAEVADLDFSNVTGELAVEGMAGQLRITDGSAAEAGHWQAAVTLAVTAGGAYLEPVFVDFSAHPLQAAAAVAVDGSAGRLTLSRFQFDQRGLARGSGRLVASPAHRLEELTVALEHADFSAAYASYLKGVLVGTPLANLEASGTLSGTFAMQRNRPTRLALTLADLDLEDRDGRFALYGVKGELDWSQQIPAIPGTLSFDGGYIHGVGFGAAAARLAMAAGDITLLEPVRVPLLDGALLIETFGVRDWDTPAVAVDFEADLEPIELRQLTVALGWAPFSGTLSGKLPRLTYKNGVVSLSGTLEGHAFDGDIQIEQLKIEQPFGVVPTLSASVRLRNLDLGLLTEVFAVGQISGRLDGDIEGLHLVKGEPIAFNASLRTPADDDTRHRISQQAVGTISKVAGGSGVILSKTFLGVFKHFGYSKLGLSCRLENDVCHMNGIEPADDGYYIVKGNLLPRLDLIGRVREVNWPRLVSQLRQAVKEGKLEVQ